MKRHPKGTREGKMMKLAITQIILGVLVTLIGSLTVGAAFSTQFGYLSIDGTFIEQMRPESVRVTRWAASAIIPLGLFVIGCGVAQFLKAKEARIK